MTTEEQKRREWRAEFVTRLFVVLFAVLFMVAVGYIVQIRVTQTHNTTKTDKAARTLVVVKKLSKQINSCVTPGRDCYQRGQQQTAEILSSAQQIIVLAAACAVDVTPAESVADRQAAIQACVTRRLTAPPATP